MSDEVNDNRFRFLNRIGSPRVRNVLIAMFDMFLILCIFFLGFYAANETNKQIERYCFQYCMLPKNQTPTDYWGTNITDITSNITIPNITS